MYIPRSFCSMVLILVLGASPACTQHKTYESMLESLLNKSVPFITAEDVRKSNKHVLLDTRARAEYEVSHIRDARWVGYDEFDLDQVRDLPKDTPIVVYCSVGYRSEKIGEKLIEAGFRNVHNLYGSIFYWINKGNPVVNPKGEVTDEVHPYNESWGKWLEKGKKVYRRSKAK